MQVLSMLEIEHLLSTCFPHAQIFNLPRRKTKPANVDALRDGLVEIAATAREIQDAADREGRELTQLEARTIDSLLARFEETESAIEAAEDGEAGRGTGRRTEPDSLFNGSFGRNRGGDIRQSPTAPGIEGRRFADLFNGISTESSDMPTIDFVRAVAKGIYDPRLIRASQGESSGAAGGYAIPTPILRAVWDSMIQQSVILPRAMIFPTASNSIIVPRPDIANRSVDVAGLQGRWIAEGGTFTVDTAEITQTSYRLNKLGTLIKISNEWLEDVPPENASLFSDLVAAVLTYDLDSSFFVGTGAGMPMGLINAGSAITVSKESGQVADTIVFQNVVEMNARMHPACRPNAVWFASPSCLPQLQTMTFPGGSSTYAEPVYLPSDGVAGKPFDTLLGRPLILTEFQPAIGDKGDLIFVDLTKYGIAMKPGMALDRSEHRYFETDEVALRGKIRCDARPLWSAAHTPRNDQSWTLGWNVQLEAR